MPTLVEVADSSIIAKALSAPTPDLQHLAKQTEGDPELLLGAIDALGSVSLRTRLAASKLLCMVSEKSPQALYPHFDALARVFRNETSTLKRNAMLALANLACVDHEDKLDAILDDYLASVSGPYLIEAANALRGATVIARAKPYLADKIARSILSVERAGYSSQAVHNVAIGHAVGALAGLLPHLRDRHSVQLFVRRQVHNPRHATSNRARRLLKKWPSNNGHNLVH